MQEGTGSSDHDADSSSRPNRLMHFGMLACCAIMLLPLAGLLAAGATLGDLWSNVGVFLPLLLCVGGHLFIHRVMGRSCHETPAAQNDEMRAERRVETGQPDRSAT